MSSAQRATCHAPSPLCSRLVLLILWLHDPLKSLLGNYKHLLMYKDGRFAKHPHFRYFTLSTEMRWRALETGHIYVRQHPRDAHLSVEELRDMVGREGELIACCTMLPLCMEPGSTGSSSAAARHNWSAHHLHTQCG